MPAGATEIKLPASEKRVVSCKILGGLKAKFSQDQNGITIRLDTTQLNPIVTTLRLKTK
jgi:hypothetical protein